ncbi:MAG: orotidine-5'-phosphate decarboxylase, partial [Candidatus Nanopelagicales bacterium]
MTSSASSSPAARAPIAVALDAPDLATVSQWSALLAGTVSTVKIGLEVYCRDGAAAVHAA